MTIPVDRMTLAVARVSTTIPECGHGRFPRGVVCEIGDGIDIRGGKNVAASRSQTYYIGHPCALRTRQSRGGLAGPEVFMPATPRVVGR